MAIVAQNYYDGLTDEEKRRWDEEQEHFWKVELPEDIRNDKADAEAEWSKQRLTWAWLYEPDIFNPGFQTWAIEDPKHPCRRIIRFSLPGDGQLRVIQEFVLHHRDVYEDRIYPKWDHVEPEMMIEAHLRVTMEVDGRLHRYCGTAQSTYPREMSASAVVFDRGTPQVVAIHSVKILELIRQPENFFALLDGTDRCAFCRHPLRDEVSKLVAVGPDCAKQYGIPHTLEAATKRLALRKKLLAEMAGAR